MSRIRSLTASNKRLSINLQGVQLDLTPEEVHTMTMRSADKLTDSTTDGSDRIDSARRKRMSVIQLLFRKQELKTWLEAVLGETITNDLTKALKDGKILIQVANEMEDGCIPRVQEENWNSWFHMDNIRQFITTSATLLQLNEHDLFEVLDLYEEKNIPRVVSGLRMIALAASEQYPHLNRYQFAEESGELETVPMTFTKEQIEQAELELKTASEQEKIQSKSTNGSSAFNIDKFGERGTPKIQRKERAVNSCHQCIESQKSLSDIDTKVQLSEQQLLLLDQLISSKQQISASKQSILGSKEDLYQSKLQDLQSLSELSHSLTSKLDLLKEQQREIESKLFQKKILSQDLSSVQPKLQDLTNLQVTLDTIQKEIEGTSKLRDGHQNHILLLSTELRTLKTEVEDQETAVQEHQTEQNIDEDEDLQDDLDDDFNLTIHPQDGNEERSTDPPPPCHERENDQQNSDHKNEDQHQVTVVEQSSETKLLQETEKENESVGKMDLQVGEDSNKTSQECQENNCLQDDHEMKLSSYLSSSPPLNSSFSIPSSPSSTGSIDIEPTPHTHPSENSNTSENNRNPDEGERNEKNDSDYYEDFEEYESGAEVTVSFDEIAEELQKRKESQLSQVKSQVGQIKAENLDLRRELFFSLCIGLKLSAMTRGNMTNIDAQELYEYIEHSDVPPSEWRVWILNQFESEAFALKRSDLMKHSHLKGRPVSLPPSAFRAFNKTASSSPTMDHNNNPRQSVRRSPQRRR